MYLWFMEASVTMSKGAALLLDAGGVLAAAGSIAKGFEWVDGALSSRGRAAITVWLTNRPHHTASDNWSSVSSDLVDRIFGPKPLSVKFFLRSCLASIIAFLIVVLIYARIHPESLDDLAHFGLAACLFATANLVPDYFSLVISRAIVRLMSRRPEWIRVLGLLALDAFAKVALATCVIYIGSAVVLVALHGTDPWRGALGVLLSFYTTFPPFSSGDGLPILGMLFYASFFTSVWVWFYVAGGLLIKGLVKSRKLWTLLAPFLDLEINPLKSIGRVIAAVYLLVGILVLGITNLVI